MRTPSVRMSTPRAEQLELETLELLPCGCVAAVQRTRPWSVRVISLEAKGPHCTRPDHRAGKVLRLGSPAELREAGEDEMDNEDEG